MNLSIVQNYKVLVVGDAIRDVYRFVDPLGRGTKEPILSVKYQNEERYEGGVWAAASHLKDLVAQVDVWHGSTVMINTKYITSGYKAKLFSVHSQQEESCPEPPDISQYDLVIAYDYGYTRFLNKELRDRLQKEARFLACMSQSNSWNFGFCRVNERWESADLVVIDELEARLAAHAADDGIEDVILKLPPYKRVIVTRGALGAIGYGQKEFYRQDALTTRPLDLLGAGDAVLAVTSPFAAAGWNIKSLVHLGIVAGYLKVSILGNSGRVTKEALEEHL